MGKIRRDEFVKFVREGKNCRHGALEMKGEMVRSYGVLIAFVDREAGKIYYNDIKISRTTSRHQSAILHNDTRLADFVFESLKYRIQN
jgi:hypothetical protein